MLVGASDAVIYGFKMSEGGRRKEPHELVFRVPRAAVDVRVHARVNVRVLELIDEETGSKIELEGNRLPVTHSHDLIKFLAGEGAVAAADARSEDEGSDGGHLPLTRARRHVATWSHPWPWRSERRSARAPTRGGPAGCSHHRA